MHFLVVFKQKVNRENSNIALVQAINYFGLCYKVMNHLLNNNSPINLQHLKCNCQKYVIIMVLFGFVGLVLLNTLNYSLYPRQQSYMCKMLKRWRIVCNAMYDLVI